MPDYRLAELAALSGLSARTIRYYVREGLVPAPGREGRATRYPAATLARLRLVRHLRDNHQPLAVIRRRLEELDDDQVVALAALPPGPPPAPDSALDFVRAVLAGEQPGSPAEDATSMLRSIVAGSPSDDVAASRDTLEMLSLQAHSFHPADIAPPGGRPASRTPSVGDRSHWEHIVLGPDVELHVRRPLSKPANRVVERLVAFARQLEEEQT